MAGDNWDDLANNLASDLAPILQLFGEQVTKQFFSQSTSVLDSVIFAMAPLGVLTAAVSVIRVCGGPVLRAFIGRAQEGANVAEVELCSSTGIDVCELYQNGGITRVFGDPVLLEVVHNPHSVRSHGRREWVRLKPWSWPWKRSTVSIEDGTEPKSNALTTNPNLMLNIAIRRQPPAVRWTMAVFSTMLQGSVIAFAILTIRHMKLKKADTVPQLWALHSMVFGTVFLCTGMFLCSFLIERSTEERIFKRCRGNSPKSITYWIQPGGQKVGDHSFDSFAHDDKDRPITEYITSWRKMSSSKDGRMTTLAVTITMLGFVLQFVGLRALHASVSLYQLFAVLLMSIFRALLRK
ncbi:hypothetical protein BDV96DRAFT_488777, partial [Lophiotrema nucula]